MRGIDISEYQGSLQLKDCKDQGYEFAILRAGYTGYGASRGKYKDDWFENFYAQSRKIDYPVGAYWYSCADSAEQGRMEAEFLYENCLKGKQFEYPIYIDVEDPHWQSDDYDGVTDAIIAFCEYLEEKGYYAGVYASLSWFYSNFDVKKLTCTYWVACWDDTPPNPPFKMDMWQNSSGGAVGYYRVDTNYCYQDFPEIIKSHGLNGYSADPLPKPEKTIDELAIEVLEGKWGNDEERYRRLTEAGYDYDAVQDRVNEMLEEETEPIKYIVCPGDTLSEIAERFDVTVDYLASLNHISDPNLIYVGQVIYV